MFNFKKILGIITLATVLASCNITGTNTNTEPEEDETAHSVLYQNVSVHKDENDQIYFSVIYELINDSANDFYLKTTTVHLKAKNSDFEKIVDISPYPQILKPNYRGYYFVTGLANELNVGEEVTMTLEPIILVSTSQLITFTINNAVFQDGVNNKLESVIDIENKTNIDYPNNVNTVVILYKIDDEPLGLLVKINTKLDAYEKKQIIASNVGLPNDISDNLNHVNIHSYLHLTSQ